MNTARNIPLLFVIKAFEWFMIYMPVIFLFYRENNFEVTELFVLHAIYSAVIAISEVPSGYVADVWGRKYALVLGTLLGAFGFFSYSLSYSLAGFIVAEILLGLGQGLISGADSALLFDSLKEQKRENNYIKDEGRISAVGNISEALAGLFVSLLVFESVRTNFYLQALFSFCAFLAALFLVEPSFHVERKKPGFSDIFDILSHTLKTNKALRNLVLFSSVIGFSSLAMAWFAQPILVEIGLDKHYFGYAWVVLNLLVAAGSLLSVYSASFFGFRLSLLIITIGLSLTYLLSAFWLSYLVFIPLSLFYIIRGLAHPVLKSHINNITSSDKRATVLSIRSLVIRLFYMIFGPMLGYLTDHISLQFALLCCGSSILIFAVIFLVPLLKTQKNY